MLDVIALIVAIFVAGFAAGYLVRSMVSRYRRRRNRPTQQRAARGWDLVPSPPLAVTDRAPSGAHSELKSDLENSDSHRTVQPAAPAEVILPTDPRAPKPRQ